NVPVCPDGNVSVAGFDPPSFTWFDAQNCTAGIDCTGCTKRDAIAVARGPCGSAAGSWTATMPTVGSTSYVVTYTVTPAVAENGGDVDLTWSAPGVLTYVSPATFSVSTCSFAATYPALCNGAFAAGNTGSCGDTTSDGGDGCPGGNAATGSFNPPSLTWWDARGCVSGTNCTGCVAHYATSVN